MGTYKGNDTIVDHPRAISNNSMATDMASVAGCLLDFGITDCRDRLGDSSLDCSRVRVFTQEVARQTYKSIELYLQAG